MEQLQINSIVLPTQTFDSDEYALSKLAFNATIQICKENIFFTPPIQIPFKVILLPRRAILLCIDGCSPRYLDLGGASWLRHIGSKGTHIVGCAMIPSVTNVNNVSILTGEYPEQHGIVSNYFFNRQTKCETFMEDPKFITSRTLLEKGSESGLKTALLTSKDKLKVLLNRGADIAFSAEEPLEWVKDELGEPPPIFSPDVDLWLLKALRLVMVRERPNIVYVSTTDYTMHKYSAGDPTSRRHISGIDRLVRDVVELLEKEGDTLLLCVTADHGMSEKKKAVDLEVVLRKNGIRSRMNTIIADRYIAHHNNMGGAVYIYLDNPNHLKKAYDILTATEGVEQVLTRDDASTMYRLNCDRIGDLFALGSREYVFGLTGVEYKDVSLRSHGSLHETTIPIIVNQPVERGIRDSLCENRHLSQIILNWFD